MSKITLLFSALMIFMFFTGCKAPACTDLSWGETSQVEENIVEMKYSAGEKCGNFNDYWDNVDVNDLIKKIQKMRFVKFIDGCIEENLETGDMETVECPEFIPETIEFGEVVGCKFDTPAGEETLCMAGPLTIFFETDTYFKTVYWEFDPKSPEFYPPFMSLENIYSSLNDDVLGKIRMEGHFSDEALSKFIIRFSWYVGDELQNKDIDYSVETKE